METITVNVYVPKAIAVADARTEYGPSTYSPSAVELTELSVEERIYLASEQYAAVPYAMSHDKRLTLETAEVSWHAIVKALRTSHAAELARKAKEAEERVKEAAQREADIVEALGKPDDNWLDRNPELSIRPPWPANQHTHDPRVRARMEALVPERDRREAERLDRMRQNKERADEQEKERVKALADGEADLLSWVTTHGPEHLARAGREGYPVTSAIVDLLVRDLCQRVEIKDSLILHAKHRDWDRTNWEPRRAPNAEAFEAYDSVEKILSSWEHPASLTASLAKIQRVTVDPPKDDYDSKPERFTALIIWVEHPCVDSRVIICPLG